MRRVVGLVLAGLGTCLIVFAVLMPTWVSSRVLKFPLNEYQSITLTGGGSSYFSPAKLTELTGVNMEATFTLKGNAAAGSSSTAVWNEFIYVYDQTNKLPFQTETRTFAFNRRTAHLLSCCGANVDGDASVRQTGYVGYVLPIGTQKQTYDIFDTNANRAMPFTYQGTGTVDGITAYRFVENVPPTQIGTQTLPGSLVGQTQASVTLPEYYQNLATFWIDPETGVLVNVTEDEKLYLEDSSGTQVLLLLDANLAATPASIKSLVANANNGRGKIALIGTTVPLTTGILGAVLLVGGLLLSGLLLGRKTRQDIAAAPAASEPELAPAAQPDRAPSNISLVPGPETEPHEPTVQSPAVQARTAEAEAAAEAPKTAVAQAPEAAESTQAKASETPAESPARSTQATAVASEAAAGAPEAAATDNAVSAETPVAAVGAAAAAGESPGAVPEGTESAAQSPQAAAGSPEADEPHEATVQSPVVQAEAPEAAVGSPEPATEAEAAVAPAAEPPEASAETAGTPETTDTASRRHRRSARHRR